MNKKGFTLVELLAVIAILGIILTIVVVSVNRTITRSKESAYQIQVHNIEQAAKVYYLQEGMSEGVTCVTLDDLISKGYIESNEVINPINKEYMGGAVEITESNNQYYYQFNEFGCALGPVERPRV